MNLDVVDRAGKTVRSIEVDDLVFGIAPRPAVVHQALLAQRANKRQGTHSTKTRGEVAGSTVKLFRQKGTGRARQGSVRAPHRRGGGIVFGPAPRSYRQRLSKRLRRLAVRSVLSSKAADGSLRVIDALGMETPRTKEMRNMLDSLGLVRSALVVTSKPDPAVKRSTRNLRQISCLPAPYLNVLDLLAHQALLMTEDAVRVAEAYWGGDRATRRLAAVPEPRG